MVVANRIHGKKKKKPEVYEMLAAHMRPGHTLFLRCSMFYTFSILSQEHYVTIHTNAEMWKKYI